MVTQQLLDYINQQIQNGTSKDDIRKTLLKSNWSENDINQAFESIKSGVPPVPQQATNASTLPDNQSRVFIVVIALLVFYPVGLVLMWMWMKDWSKWVKILLSLPILFIIFWLVAFSAMFIFVLTHPNNIKNLQPPPTKPIYATPTIFYPSPTQSPMPTYAAPSVYPTSSTISPTLASPR